MNQIKFIWLSNNIPNIVGINMDPNGITTVSLRELIDIIHNSKKMDKIEILFKDDNTKYEIPDQKTLEEIYDMHISNEEVMLLLHQYCSKNLNIC